MKPRKQHLATLTVCVLLCAQAFAGAAGKQTEESYEKFVQERLRESIDALAHSPEIISSKKPNGGFDEFFGFTGGAHSYLTAGDKPYGPIVRGHQPVELKGYLTEVLADEAADFMPRHHGHPFFLSDNGGPLVRGAAKNGSQNTPLRGQTLSIPHYET